MTRNYGAPTATAWAVLVGFLIITPITWRDARAQDWNAVGPIGWAGLFFAAYVSLLVGYNLWTWAIQRAGVGRTAPYLLVLPVLTGIMSAVLTGERFGPLKVLGAVLVLAGTAVVRLVAGRAARRKASQAEMRS
ncbi:MAG: DMT family transporter, partial [Chloroflexota bacterium]